ncbi:MAG TPA: energy transducer TonB [Dongiaceae bacterium]|nr:energy transducer TonB [Dongiaceae bacterium]
MRGFRLWKAGKVAASAAMMGILLLPATAVQAQEKRKIIANPEPVYPEIAKVAGLRGVVKVQVVIGTDGTIKDAKIIGGHPMLVESVKDALKRWKYAPSNSETVTILEFAFHP